MRLAVLTAALLGTFACTRNTDLPSPAKYITAGHPKSVWVQRRDATMIRVDAPTMARDTIVGTTKGTPIKIPMNDVRGVAIRQTDWPMTDALIGAGAMLGFFVVMEAISTDTAKTPSTNQQVP